MVKVGSGREMPKLRRKMVDTVIEPVPESNAPESRGEMIDRSVECVSDYESIKVRWQQVVYGFVEPVADVQARQTTR